MKPNKFLALCFAEPFRIFFPLGLLLGAIGVALWPLYVWHEIGFYPANAHVRSLAIGLSPDGSAQPPTRPTKSPRPTDWPAETASDDMWL